MFIYLVPRRGVFITSVFRPGHLLYLRSLFRGCCITVRSLNLSHRVLSESFFSLNHLLACGFPPRSSSSEESERDHPFTYELATARIKCAMGRPRAVPSFSNGRWARRGVASGVPLDLLGVLPKDIAWYSCASKVFKGGKGLGRVLGDESTSSNESIDGGGRKTSPGWLGREP
jgi:hypothetical protein